MRFRVIRRQLRDRTYRRVLLDILLEANAEKIRGIVLDVGGKREARRGRFRPSERQDVRWVYLNLDGSTRPDVIGDARSVPLRGNAVDWVVCTEVLEHLDDPSACVREIHRSLKPGGTIIASVPFLFPVHADPVDYWRFTGEGLRHLFEAFSTVRVEPMGGFPGALGTLTASAVPDISGRGICLRALKRLLGWIADGLCWLDLRLGQERRLERRFTTGFFVHAIK